MSADDPARAFALAFHEVLRRHQFQDVEQVCEFGITLSECHSLEVMVLDGPMSVNELAARLAVNKSTASRVVQALADKKLVRREVSDSDARSWTVEATPAGRRLFEKILESSARCYASVLDGLDASEAKLVLDVLRRISAAACRSTSCT
jgi:MarR family transcriptional regulator, 2-MHQ and catechol-resistance regulon repressor